MDDEPGPDRVEGPDERRPGVEPILDFLKYLGGGVVGGDDLDGEVRRPGDVRFRESLWWNLLDPDDRDVRRADSVGRLAHQEPRLGGQHVSDRVFVTEAGNMPVDRPGYVTVLAARRAHRAYLSVDQFVAHPVVGQAVELLGGQQALFDGHRGASAPTLPGASFARHPGFLERLAHDPVGLLHRLDRVVTRPTLDHQGDLGRDVAGVAVLVHLAQVGNVVELTLAGDEELVVGEAPALVLDVGVHGPRRHKGHGLFDRDADDVEVADVEVHPAIGRVDLVQEPEHLVGRVDGVAAVRLERHDHVPLGREPHG